MSRLLYPSGAALLAAALVGCERPAPEPAVPVGLKGIVTVIEEVAPGEFRIQDEQPNDWGLVSVTVLYLNGDVRTITDPATFQQYLPPVAPAATYEPVAHPGGGFDLGDVLLMSLVMRAWQPAAYPLFPYTPTRSLYVDSTAYAHSSGYVRPQIRAAQERGTLATPERVRATTPSSTRSGSFGSRPGAS